MKSNEILVEYPVPLAGRRIGGAVRGAVAGAKNSGFAGAVSGATAGWAQGLGDQRVANTSKRVYGDWAMIVKNLPPGSDYTTELVNYIDQRFSKYVQPGTSQIPAPTIANATDYNKMQQYIDARTRELWTKSQPVAQPAAGGTQATGSAGTQATGSAGQSNTVDEIKRLYGSLTTGEKNQLAIWLSGNP